MEGSQMSTTPAATVAPIGSAPPVAVAPEKRAKAVSMTREKALSYVWATTRLGLGWIFLWAFLDKMFGLGHETASADSWIHGGSPTEGFLSGSVGPFSSIYHGIAGAGLVDGLFMVGLAAVGLLLILGIGMRFACGAGALMVVLMWSAALPPENNLFLDDHIIYALVLIGLALVGAGNTLGLGRWWTRTSLVQRFPWLT
jgi:thiosulfate dehydrogenase [quinone] large subunit